MRLADNFLSSPLGFKEGAISPTLYVCSLLALTSGIISGVIGDRVKEFAIQVEERNRTLSRRLAADKALKTNPGILCTAKNLCREERIDCDEFGCPVNFPSTPSLNTREHAEDWNSAKRVAEAYKPTLLTSLQKALGDEIVAKLAEPEKYLLPATGHSHNAALCFCKLEFNHADKSLFRGVLLPMENRRDAGCFIIPDNLNITVSHCANFGMFDPGFGEQFLPGDLLIVIGVMTVDDMTSFYMPWRFQVNPTAETFLKELSAIDAVPRNRL